MPRTFRRQRFKRSCFDCPVYTLTYGEGEIKADLLSVPRDVEAPIRDARATRR